MIIDIVDLASGALKAKDTDDKLAVDAINVVMDFCDHAASLFDAVAQVSACVPYHKKWWLLLTPLSAPTGC